MTLPDDWIESVSPAAADGVRAHYVALGYVVETLAPPQPYVTLYIHRPRQEWRLPLPGERGFDLSHYNGLQTAAGFREAMEAGYTWAGFKLGENGIMDRQVIANVKLAREVGLPYLVYFFWRYDVPSNLQFVQLETMLGNNQMGPPPLGLAIDLEECKSIINGQVVTIDPAPYAATMIAALGDFLLGCRRIIRTIVYSRATWIVRWFNTATYLADYEHWAASWPYLQPTYGVNRPTVHPFWRGADNRPNDKVIAWQFYAPNSGLRYEIMVPGVGAVDQNYWLAPQRG